MNQELMEYIKNHIKEYMPLEYQDASVVLEEVTKNNDRVLTGLIVRRDGETIAPAVYLEQYAEQIDNGRSLDSIMREIATIQTDYHVPAFDLSSLEDYEKVKPVLAIRLYDPEKNQDYLKDKPHTPCGDLTAAYQIQISKDNDGVASAIVTNSLLQTWGISTEQLHKDALASESNRETVCFHSMEDVMSQLMLNGECPNLLNADEVLSPNMGLYVLTNESRLNGAGILAQNNVLEQVGNLLQSDFYVLPSSIHEVLVVPDDGTFALKELESIVKEVNATQVAPKDLLSDKVQYYDRETKILGRKQAKSILEKLAENKEQIQKNSPKKQDMKHVNNNEPSL